MSPLLSPRWLACVGPKNLPLHTDGARNVVEFADGRAYEVEAEDLTRWIAAMARPCLSIAYATTTPRKVADFSAANLLFEGRSVDWPAWRAHDHNGLTHAGTVVVQTHEAPADGGAALRYLATSRGEARSSAMKAAEESGPPVAMGVCHTTMLWWPNVQGVWVVSDTLPRSVGVACGSTAEVEALRGALSIVAMVVNQRGVSYAATHTHTSVSPSNAREEHTINIHLESDPTQVTWVDGEAVPTVLHSRGGFDSGVPLPSHGGYFIAGESGEGTQPLTVGLDGGAIHAPLGILEHPYTSIESVCSYFMAMVDTGMMPQAQATMQGEVSRVRSK